MHTMARVKNSNLGVGQSAEPDVRQRGEAAIVRGSELGSVDSRTWRRSRGEVITRVPWSWLDRSCLAEGEYVG